MIILMHVLITSKETENHKIKIASTSATNNTTKLLFCVLCHVCGVFLNVLEI